MFEPVLLIYSYRGLLSDIQPAQCCLPTRRACLEFNHPCTAGPCRSSQHCLSHSVHPHLFSGNELTDHALLFASARMDQAKAGCCVLGVLYAFGIWTHFWVGSVKTVHPQSQRCLTVLDHVFASFNNFFTLSISLFYHTLFTAPSHVSISTAPHNEYVSDRITVW